MFMKYLHALNSLDRELAMKMSKDIRLQELNETRKARPLNAFERLVVRQIAREYGIEVG